MPGSTQDTILRTADEIATIPQLTAPFWEVARMALPEGARAWIPWTTRRLHTATDESRDPTDAAAAGTASFRRKSSDQKA